VIIPAPINRAMAHFIQPGILKTSLKTKDPGRNPPLQPKSASLQTKSG
jgi:hypothetical protein